MRVDGAIVCFGELLLRLSAPGAQRLLQAPSLDVSYGGAEANVAVSLARLGHDVRMVSTLPDNPLGRAVRDQLRGHGVDVGGVDFAEGRMGLYFLAPGAGLRASDVTYDRARSAFAEQDFSALAWDARLQGAGWFHVSGITAALGPAVAEATINATRRARAAGLTVSFDCNYRARLWQAWSGDAAAILRTLLAEAHVLFGDHRDISLALGAKLDQSNAAAEAAFAAFPDLERITHTRRVEHSVGQHDLSAVMYTRSQVWSLPAIGLTGIVDRIGAGDAFVAGVTHALRRGSEGDAVLEFALMAAALKHATPGDWNCSERTGCLSGDESRRIEHTPLISSRGSSQLRLLVDQLSRLTGLTISVLIQHVVG